MSTREQILQILEPIASNMGLDLEDVEIKSAGKHSIVQVSIDKDGGINLDEVAQISNQISEALDAKEVLGEKPYTLEVGSPGIDRALTLPRHWRINDLSILSKLIDLVLPLTSNETFSSSDSIIRPISEFDPKFIFTNLPLFLLQ